MEKLGLIFHMKKKINKIIEEISKKNKINSRKDREIKLLGAQLVKFKKYLKSGNLEKIQNEPDIEILGDDEDSDIGQNDGETELTEKTGFDEGGDINNVKVNKSKKLSEETGDEIGNEQNNEDEENNEHELKSHNDDGDNIVNRENNEALNTGEVGEVRSNISHEEEN